MEDVNLYRSKLRSPSGSKSYVPDNQWEHPSQTNFLPFGAESLGNQISTPSKVVNHDCLSPHKSGYFLRTPSPLKKLRATLSPLKSKRTGTPSPQKANSATDLFGNKSLLDNLEVPEDWDENFLNNFQEDWLFGFGNDDLENLTKSPLKSPRQGLFCQNNTPKKLISGLSPFKSPLLTSSPKFYNSSPGGDRTPGISGGRPVTRQRKLFLQSPEHQVPQPSTTPPTWPAPIPFSTMLDTSSSSLLSDGGPETSSIQSISSYLKNIDEEDNQEDLPVMPPAGWTSKAGKGNRVGKSAVKVTSKTLKSKRGKSFTSLESAQSGNINCHSNPSAIGPSPVQIPKKLKTEPQFTLLRPYTALHTNQISLRTTPVTPPNKMKISRDFSQIQTLPSKEQLRIVRSRFRDTLNKAVEQYMEQEKSKQSSSQQQQSDNKSAPAVQTNSVVQNEPQPAVTVTVPPPITQTPVQIQNLFPHCNNVPQYNLAMKPPPCKKRKR